MGTRRIGNRIGNRTGNLGRSPWSTVGVSVAVASCLLVASALTGCDEAEKANAQERAVEREQQAISDYSDQVPTVDALQERFTEAWRQANERRDVKELKDAIAGAVLPALEKYVAAMKAMPTASGALATIHKTLVDAHAARLESFRGFVENLTEKNLIEQYEALLEGYDELRAAEVSYRKELRSYYDRHRVNLVEK